MKISEMVEQVHENAKSKGFWDDWKLLEWKRWNDFRELSAEELNVLRNAAIASRLALIHSEVSEALEALRVGDMENFAEELADVVIRVADTAGGLGIDLEGEITNKMEKNKVRGYMHGKRF
ncbi:MAG TPA: nucleotide pyrophosphohydrolase [Epulopiscium sp.]|nr:nucleotide pyrophosphohydrolase [Candidatus Epulonipiscium sp.]